MQSPKKLTLLCCAALLGPNFDAASLTDEEPQDIPGYVKSTSDDESDDDEAEEEAAASHSELQPRRKPGGYDSRIEQLLYENPETPIYITDAGKSVENSGRYIVYTIRTGVSFDFVTVVSLTLALPHRRLTILPPQQDLEVRRRYSEFATLRDALTRLHPTLIIPPIPEKHTMADYAASPTNAKQDQQIIDLRKRMLAVFLNRCRRMEQIRTDGVWWRFLDPNASWVSRAHMSCVLSVPRFMSLD